LLRELIGQDFDIDDDGVPRLHRGTRPDRVLSVVDPEMRHGRKSQHHRFDGYKLAVTSTDAAAPLITAVAVTAANVPDGAAAARLIDAQPHAWRPERLLGDTAYGIGAVRAELADRGVDVLAPLAPGDTRPEHLAKQAFVIDFEANSVRCPAGATAPIRREPSGARRARFDKAECDHCALRERCVTPARGDRAILLAEHEELLQAARRALDDPTTAERLRRRRPRIERLLGLLAHRYGTRKSRYRGRRKAELQAAWAAALVNLNPIATTLMT
jgi:hypothetical protein